MRAVIPVAGVGTRLRPHTYALPKVLLNVAGKPILSHILDSLQTIGISDATIITGYMGDLVEEFVRSRYPALNVEFVEQRQMLGLGHAIWTGKDTYKDDEPLLIILGDTVFDVDLSLAINSGVSAIGVKAVNDPRRFGVILLNNASASGQRTINKFIEKPEKPVSNLAIVGLYYIAHSNKLVSSLDELISKDIRTKNEFQLTDALQLMLDNGEVFTYFNVDGWYDCGKPETLLSTNNYLLSQYPAQREIKGAVIIPPCYVSDTAIVENSIIGPYASIADGAIVKDSIIRHSIISDGAKVSHSLLTESIIGNEAEVNGKFTKYNVGNSSTIDLE
ncbi:MAG: NTP transferase domain-containing protein [Ignavibacteria bacterium]|jgi:glucose-1-phosphate thymidylyltransferase|nr:NTP transferase domain-containing protein [Ignavibacteria bacterium]